LVGHCRFDLWGCLVAGCRDCGTCTRLGLLKWIQDMGLGLLHWSTAGVSLLVKRACARHCPGCKHLLSGHAVRADGSFMD